ncbi:leucyl aminopeptidase [Marinicrinis sediminis]|uniref:Probable cytosol aminopeptidase n=1 Tax=Marinicrinis sediminis TaxID=1652465 RepID=A0ABW5R827_9BACL
MKPEKGIHFQLIPYEEQSHIQMPAFKGGHVHVAAVTEQMCKQSSSASISDSTRASTFQALTERGVLTGKRKEWVRYPLFDHPTYTDQAWMGLGANALTLHQLRTAAVYAARNLADGACSSCTILLMGDDELTQLTLLDQIYAWTEGLQLGTYKRKTYHHNIEQRNEHRNGQKEGLQTVILVLPKGISLQPEMQRAMKRGKYYAMATNYARDLTNEPANFQTPQVLADEARLLANLPGIEVNIHDEAWLQQKKMNGLLYVGKGSVHPPCLAVIQYNGADQSDDTLAFVGKGVTFDTGGISLKKAEGMEEMISDMGGAAVVMAVMKLMAELQLPLNAVAVVPIAENMPSGRAYKPGDIIRSYSGKTIEVLNTDAEGRIILGDAVTYARELGATRIVEVSTLTGASLIALGDVTTAALTNEDAFLEQFLQAASPAGERIWALPNYPEYWDMLKSDVADLTNSPGKWAATITAGLFIGAFAEDTPWIHLDTGGTAWLWNEQEVDPIGGTGSMVRSIAHFVEREVQR